MTVCLDGPSSSAPYSVFSVPVPVPVPETKESKTPLNYFDQDRTDVHNFGIVSMLSPLIRRADAKSGTGTGTGTV